ncbi:Reverse gyrase 1 [Labeo rohita]|uniref:Reverse gyrase 1 n=1 Tax=Labeo rohita TaxID=84645 RepID=A0ABQ8L9V6_LABRO|nr:Reverse gyrase 1 [Labeo rohita]
MAAAVLDKIARKCQQIERAQSQGNCGERELCAIYDCLRNAQIISYLLPPETYEELNRSSRSRPAIQITRDQTEFLMKQGHTVKRMARMLGCSSSFLYKRSKLLGLSIRSRMSRVDDGELENVVRRLQWQYPNTGNDVTLLVAEGLKVSCQRVREMLVLINPAAAARRWSSTVTRRVYYVPYPNSLWHIDGNMCLIRLV